MAVVKVVAAAAAVMKVAAPQVATWAGEAATVAGAEAAEDPEVPADFAEEGGWGGRYREYLRQGRTICECEDFEDSFALYPGLETEEYQ